MSPLRMSAVEEKPQVGTKRPAEGDAPNEPTETKAEKKARRAANNAKTLGVHVVGLSHHNAGVDVREKLAVPEAEWNMASAEVCVRVCLFCAELFAQCVDVLFSGSACLVV